MSNEPAEDTYENTFIAFSNQIEAYICRGLIIMAVLLLAAQALLHIPKLRHALVRVDKLEGIPYLFGQERKDI